MDPEIIAQLEEQLRELTETISRQTSMMGQQMDAMNKMASSAGATAQANTGAAQTTTKYQEAQVKALGEQEKTTQSLRKLDAALGVLSASVGAAAGVLGSVANSLLSSQKGLSKYGEVANQAAAGAEKMASSIPIVGDALGALVGTIGKIGAKLVSDGLAMVDSLTTLRDGLVKTGGSLPVTAGQLADLAKDARYSGENMKVLGKITESLGTGLRSLDATAGRGAVKFMEMANVTDETRRQFGRMGVDQERLTELQALYVKQQQASGNSYDLQTKTAAQLRKESLAYAENMQKLSALTGKQAEQLQAEQEAVAAVVQERMATLKEMSDEKRLREAGDEAGADAIRAEREKRQKFAQELQKMGLTQDEQMKAMQMYRLGAYTDYTKSMAQLNPGLMSLAQGVKNGSINVEQGAKEFGEGLTEGKIRLSNNFNGIADAMDPQVLGDTFGLTSETLKAPLDQLGKSLGDATAAADADTTAAKTRTDEVGDAVENIKSAERELQAKYQDFLMTQIESISKLINQVDIFTEIQEHAATVAKVMAAGMAAVVAGNVALAAAAWRAASNLDKIAKGMDRMGRGGEGGGPLGDAEDKAKGKGKKSWGRRLAKGLKGGIAGIVGGLALDYAADKATEAGHTKTGAALGIGSSALSGAGTGAMIGSVIPGVGTAIGGAVGGVLGGLYGLYNNWGSLTGSDEEKKRREKEVAALKKRTEEAKKTIGAPAAATAAAGAAALIPAAGTPQQQQAMNKVVEDQIEQNKRLFREPMQQTEEERKAQMQVYNDLSSSMTAFKKNVDGSSKALIDLMNASDELYKALTGRDRPGSEAAKAAAGAPPGPGGVPGGIPQDVTGNLEKIAASLRKAGYSDDNYINAVLGNVMKESGGRFDKQEDIAGYANTDNARIREIFKTKTRGMSDAELSALKADPQAFANKMYGDRAGNNKPGDGWLFRGRGPIQLTGRGNYSKASRDIYGDDRLVQNPDLVMDPEVGAQVVAWFMKQNEDQMRGKLGFSKEQALSQADAALLATSQIAGQKITRGQGHLGTENLQKAEGYAAQMPSGMGTGKPWVSNDSLIGATRQATGALKDFAVTGQARTGGNLTSVSTQGKTAQVSVDAAPQFQKLLDAMTKSGYKIKSLGGYINRNIAGTNIPSAHGMGWAIDVNPDENPDTGKSNKLITDMPPEVIKYARELGLGWGGAWSNKKDAMHFSAQKNEGGWLQAARGGIFRGPKDGYPMELHGTEMIIPLDTPNMRGNKIGDLMSSLTKTGVKEGGIGKINKINDAVMQIVNMETTKAIKAVSEANSPLQSISTEISNSMRKVMEAHNSTMNELTYKLGDMIDALNTSNDVTKKILKKASA